MSWFWRTFVSAEPPWEGDCTEHDKAYWQGGSAKQRRKADANLLIKVAGRGYVLVAIAMWISVRVGGHPLLPTSWRWGYGWKYLRWYRDDVSP